MGQYLCRIYWRHALTNTNKVLNALASLPLGARSVAKLIALYINLLYRSAACERARNSFLICTVSQYVQMYPRIHAATPLGQKLHCEKNAVAIAALDPELLCASRLPDLLYRRPCRHRVHGQLVSRSDFSEERR
jgi:hypothetical protein